MCLAQLFLFVGQGWAVSGCYVSHVSIMCPAQLFLFVGQGWVVSGCYVSHVRIMCPARLYELPFPVYQTINWPSKKLSVRLLEYRYQKIDCKDFSHCLALTDILVNDYLSVRGQIDRL